MLKRKVEAPVRSSWPDLAQYRDGAWRARISFSRYTVAMESVVISIFIPPGELKYV